jgi:hypothetical protein
LICMTGFTNRINNSETRLDGSPWTESEEKSDLFQPMYYHLGTETGLIYSDLVELLFMRFLYLEIILNLHLHPPPPYHHYPATHR